jgi:uncharacterized protein YbbK (DUF523 family)
MYRLDQPLPRIRIGISACLLGSRVRYDGQHKRDSFLADELTPLVDWVPVCPEVEVGMGVPREPVRLIAGRSGGGRGWSASRAETTGRRG